MSFIIKNEELDDNKNKKDTNEVENIKELGNYPPAPFASDIFTMTIIGQIEGHTVLPPQTKSTKYEHIFPQLVNVEENPNIKGLLVILNTVGGDVEAGLAIAEMINSITKPTVSLVVGGGHSIGVPLAVATDYSFISPTATMIIHPIRMNGLVIGVPQTFAYFQKMQDRILSFITRNSKVSKEKLRELMLETDELLNDMGTILIGNQAVELGLIDEVGGIGEAYKKLRDMVDRANA
ncbi:MAG: Clp protease [Caloramator sp.]|jgi:ATP-dependent protease ClpP protease subunit|uniref:ClpP family protease n=1 Tax=Caloramator sp. TaxID=1871330 RepID=UPI001D7D5241|nr:ATP-dependent Clp protease proteolytic subunit [Caloramator sp.]MBZ4663496.1 Clp protease [Caloramator sp.]